MENAVQALAFAAQGTLIVDLKMAVRMARVVICPTINVMMVGLAVLVAVLMVVLVSLKLTAYNRAGEFVKYFK